MDQMSLNCVELNGAGVAGTGWNVGIYELHLFYINILLAGSKVIQAYSSRVSLQSLPLSMSTTSEMWTKNTKQNATFKINYVYRKLKE